LNEHRRFVVEAKKEKVLNNSPDDLPLGVIELSLHNVGSHILPH
jgi:hypothetical protein